MKDDQLEEFIKNNREDFDSEVPSEKTWEPIERSLRFSFKRSSGWIWKAAAVGFFLLASFLLWERSKEPVNQGNNMLSEEFIEAEMYYNQLISEKKDKLDKLTKDQENLQDELSNDLLQLDSAYTALKKEYVKFGDQKVLNAMILNLQTRTTMLNRQIEILMKFKKEENEKVLFEI